MTPAERRAEANARMTMSEALTIAGTDAYGGYSGKIFCPFGDTMHADGGRERAMRNYGDHAYCFAGCGSFTPVTMVALAMDLSRDDAAEWILERTGFVEPTWQARVAALQARVETVDTDVLAEVLREECRRLDPQWETRQYDEGVSRALARCLSILPDVKTAADARTWKQGVTTVMASVLRRTA